MLIDAKGYIIHIDFGFMLAFSPGGINFEAAPFKFTNVYYLENNDFSEKFIGIFGINGRKRF